jgi:hypothetical protein
MATTEHSAFREQILHRGVQADTEAEYQHFIFGVNNFEVSLYRSSFSNAFSTALVPERHGGTEIKHGKPQSGQSVSRLKIRMRPLEYGARTLNTQSLNSVEYLLTLFHTQSLHSVEWDGNIIMKMGQTRHSAGSLRVSLAVLLLPLETRLGNEPRQTCPQTFKCLGQVGKRCLQLSVTDTISGDVIHGD